MKRLVALLIGVMVLCILTCSAAASVTPVADLGTLPEESEPNNSTQSADSLELNGMIYGSITSDSDVDYFSLNATGGSNGSIFVSLSVGNSSQEDNYCMYIYNSSGTFITKTTDSVKTISLTASSGPFTLMVFRSDDGYSSTIAYNIKTYSAATVSVPRYVQETNSTCGAACVRMILSYYGLEYSEEEIAARANALSGNQGTYVYAQKNVINYYLAEAGITTRYCYIDMTSAAQSAYDSCLWNNISRGYPVQLVLKISDTTYFPYTTDGHYVVAKGLNRSNTQNLVILNDPHYAYSAVYNVPADVLRGYGNAHCGHVICVVS